MFQRFRPIAVLACLLGTAGPAHAVDVQTWRVVPGLHDGWLVRSAQPMASEAWTTFADLSYTRAPLRFSADVGGVTQRQTVIGDLGMVQLGGAMGLAGGWTLGAVLPVAAIVRGGGPELVRTTTPDAPAFGDLRLEGRYGLLHRPTMELGLAAIVTLPTGSRASWLGGDVGEGLEVLGDWHDGPWRAQGNLGLALRQVALPILDSQGRSHTEGGADVVVRLALARAIVPAVRIRAEGQWLGGVVPGQVKPGGASSVLDLALGGDYALTDAVRLYALLGGSPTSDAGSAGFRAAVGLRLDPQQLPHDADGDGLDDRVDECPTQAEDKDGFEDEDGCPDPDNDGDQIPDTKDQCPNAPEDVDGYRDDDGCPDVDNDGDGLPDARDKCPNQAEDPDGFDDDDGCPENDNDQDGIPDIHDLCPLSPESKNGFEDEDGCPDVAPGQGKPKQIETPPAPAAVQAPAPAPAPGNKAAPAKGKAPAKGRAPAKGKPADEKPRANLKPL